MDGVVTAGSTGLKPGATEEKPGSTKARLNAGPTRTIFLTINRAVNVRDIMRGKVFETLKTSGHRIVVLSPASTQPEFLEEFAANNVVFEPLIQHEPTWLDRKLLVWRFTWFPDLTESTKMISTPRVPRGPLKRLLVAGAMLFKRIVGERAVKRAMMWANVHLAPDRHHKELFERYKPDLVVLTEVFSLAPDAWIHKRAIQSGVPTVWLVRSWDNLVTKGVLPATVSKMVVWSETMREEALTLHDYAPDDVYVAGAPHLDIVTDASAIASRETFFRQIGADPSKRLITYAMAPLTKADLEFEQQVVRHLWELASRDGFAEPCQIMVRCYPLRSSLVPPALENLPGLLFDVPGRSSPVFTDRDINREDLRHLGATLRYSSVVVNVASTIALESVACGTPAICLGFELEPRPYLRSHIRYFDQTYFKKLWPCGGVKLARSMDDLVASINAYLRDGSLDQAGRERVVERMYWRVDRQAGERAARFVLGYLERLSA